MNKLNILSHWALAMIATAFPLTVIAKTNSAPTDPSNNTQNSGALVNSTGSKPRTGGAEIGMSTADKKFVEEALLVPFYVVSKAVGTILAVAAGMIAASLVSWSGA
jgi:hypothetical protein